MARHSFKATSDVLALAIKRACSSLGWRVTEADRSGSLMVAQFDKDQIVRGRRWSYKFEAHFRWWQDRSTDASELTLEISVRERHSSIAGQSEISAHAVELLTAVAAELELAEKAKPVSLDPKVYPQAKFATANELTGAGYLDAVDVQLSFLLGSMEDRLLTLPPQAIERHVLVEGPTGSGKTGGIFIPNLLAAIDISGVVTEAILGNEPPHVYERTAGIRHKFGHQIYYFNPSAEKTWRINPLDCVHNESHARHVTDLLMRTTTQQTHRADQYWETGERMLLTALILHAIGERENGNANLGHIIKLLQLDERSLAKVARWTKYEEAADRLEAFLKRGTENTRNILMSCLLQRLDLWSDKRIAALTNHTDVEFEKLQEQLFTFYMIMPISSNELRPLFILIWNYLLDFIENSTFKHPLRLYLDEFSNLGYIKGMREKLTMIRHKHIGAIFGIQSKQQLSEVYEKEASVFFTQTATRIFFRPQSLDEAKEISESLGMTTIPSTELHGTQISIEKVKRPLMAADELMRMGTKDAPKFVAFLPDCLPALVTPIQYSDYDNVEVIPPPDCPDLPETGGLTPRHANPQVFQQVAAIAVPKVALDAAKATDASTNPPNEDTSNQQVNQIAEPQAADAQSDQEYVAEWIQPEPEAEEWPLQNNINPNLSREYSR